MDKETFYKELKKLHKLAKSNSDETFEKVCELIERLNNRFASGYLCCLFEQDTSDELIERIENIATTHRYGIWGDTK